MTAGASRAAGISRREFVAVVAACQAMAASSIDLMIPAFKDIRVEFGLAPDSNRVAWIVTAFFLGIAAGQVVYGPLSDRFGRKPLLYTGLAIMITSSAAAALVSSLTAIFVCRVIWGLGAAAPRSLAIAMVRDRFGGEEMARTMGLVMAVFMMVPILAPSVGTVLMLFAPWRILFWTPCVLAAFLALWLTRLPESHPPERRRGVRPRDLFEAFRIVATTRATVAYALATFFQFATMASFIGNLELIINDVYDLDGWFPAVFAGLGITLAVGSFVSSRIVARVGLVRLIRRAAVAYVTAVSAVFVVVLVGNGRPNFVVLCSATGSMLFAMSFLNATTNTAAMQPVPHVAGMAAAIMGATATGTGALLASIINASFDNTLRPFAFGIFCFGIAIGACVFVLAPRYPKDTD